MRQRERHGKSKIIVVPRKLQCSIYDSQCIENEGVLAAFRNPVWKRQARGGDPLEGPKTRRQCNLLSAQSQKGQHSYFPPTLRQKYHSYSSPLKSLPAGQIKKIIKILCFSCRLMIFNDSYWTNWSSKDNTSPIPDPKWIPKIHPSKISSPICILYLGL